MDRSKIEDLIREVYKTRTSNDLAAVLNLFARNAVFHMAGANGPGRIAARAEGQQSISDIMATLVSAWSWIEVQILDLLVDGASAAVRYRATMRFLPTQAIVVTDLFDLIKFEDGKIAELVEFCDTALAASLINDAMSLAGKGAGSAA